MTIHFHWFVPTSGDGEYLGLKSPERPPTLDYLIKVAKQAEESGFEGILIPTGIPYLDSWIVGSAIIHHTAGIKPLVAFRPGFISPTVAAKMASTLDQFSKGRVNINVVTGGSSMELGQDGDFLPHDIRYKRTDEFLEVIKKAWEHTSFEHNDTFFQVKAGSLKPKNYGNRSLPIYFGGSSEAAKEVAAKHADVYLQWGEPVEQIHEQIQDVQNRAARLGRKLEYGVRIHVITRDTEKEAWEAADKLLSKIDVSMQTNMNHYYQDTDSSAQKRMNELVKENDRFGKYKWAGIGKIRKGAGTAIVGTPEQVREGLQEYIDIGVNHFILSGFPHVEEAKRFGETVMPFYNNSTRGVHV